jgi:inosose dehydratase
VTAPAVHRDLLARVGAAPISWGVCEAPGWGLQLSPERVLAEMQALGIRATELGALGWLPKDPVAIRTVLEGYDLRLIGGFVPLVLHDPARRQQALADARTAADLLADAGADHFVTAVVSSTDTWARPPLDATAWTSIFSLLAEVDRICADRGLVQVLHPHVDTLVEQADEVERFLSSSSVQLCLDTGHLMLGGADPAAIAVTHLDRVGLVHLKDLDATIAQRLTDDELSLFEATAAGLFPPAGSGCVPIGEIAAGTCSNKMSLSTPPPGPRPPALDPGSPCRRA